MTAAAAFVIAILGCSDDGASCRQARLLPARYASAAACDVALPRRLAENSDVQSPSIAADCRPAAAERTASTDAEPRPRG